MSGLEHSQKAPLQRAVSDLERAFLVARRSALLLLTKLDRLAHFQRLAVLWAMGSIALALVTFVCFRFGLNFAGAAFAFLIVIVFLSLLDSFVSSALFSVIAIGCLNFFFVEPLYTFEVADAQDVIALAAFLTTSLAVTGLVRRARALGEVRSEQGRLLDLITDAVFVRDRADVIIYWNRGAEQLYGWKREEAVGKVTHELLQTVFPVPLAEITETLSRTGRWEGELVHKSRAGAKVSVASRWSLQQDERGLTLGTLESNTDITERKRAEEAQRRSQAAYLAEAQKLSHTGSFGWNASNGEIFWSDETFRIFGYEPTTRPSIEMVLQRVHPDDVALVRQVVDRAASDNQNFDFEHRLLMPDGSVKHLHVVAHAGPNGSDHLQFIGAVSDITARKQGFAKLEASEQRYRHLFHHMPVALWQLNARGVLDLFKQLRSQGVTDLGAHFDAHPGLLQRCMEMLIIEEVNEHTVQMLGGRNTSEFVGTSIARYFPENSATFRRSMVSRYRGDPNYAAETKLFTLDGRVVDVLYTASRVGPISEPGLSLLGVIDITERKKAEESLRRSEQRYQSLFQAMAVSFFEVDYTSSRQMLRVLRDDGVVDFRRYFKENPAFVRQIMQATRVVDVNDQAVALFGRGSKEEFLTSGGTFWPEESIQDYIEAVLASLERNQAFSAETRMRKLDGTIFDAHFTAWYAPEDTARGLVGVIDITARKQAFLALERSEQRYRHLFNYMPIALQQLDATRLVELFKALRAQGITDLGPYFDAHPDFLKQCMEALIVEEVNQRTVQLLGVRDAGELVGKPVGPSWGERPDTFRRAMETRFRGATSFEEETKWVRRDGRTVDVLFTASRVGPIDGPGISLVGAMDISQRVQAFLALEKSEQRYRHLFHSMPLALWQLNGQRLGDMFRELRAQGVNDLSAHIDDHPGFVSDMIDAMVVEEVNDYAVKMFGARDRNELLGPTHWLWAKNTDTPRRAFEGRWLGREFFQETTKLATRDGRVIDALYTVARPRLDAGLPIAFATMIDLTEQVRAQTELQQVRADFAHAARISMLGELTASIAHEVNQPLAAIAAGGEAGLRWLARPTPDVDEVRELTKGVVADARRASEIIARIRTMATRRAPEQKLLLLDDVIREALLFLRHEVQSRGVMVSHFPATAAPKVFADRTQLQQVIVNLAVNAMQAFEHAGSSKRNIAIRTVAHDPASLRCSVEDSGPGLEAQHVSRLFDSFFTTKDGGMGMGLRICRSVIEAHGGRIGADNESSLGGARFYFTVPVATTVT